MNIWRSLLRPVDTIVAAGQPFFTFDRANRARRKLSWLVTAVICLGFVAAPLVVQADEIDGGETLPSTDQRQIIFDTTFDNYWLFYTSGSVVKYSYSADALSWTEAGTLPYGYNDFHVLYQEINGDGKLFFTTVCADFDICLLQGTTIATSIVFEAERTVYNGSPLLGAYSHPVSRLDGNTVLYVAAFHSLAQGGQQAVVRTSGEGGGSTINTFNGISEIGVPNNSLGKLVMIPNGQTEMYIIIGNEGGAMTGYNSSNGAIWNPIGNGSTYSWKEFGTNGITHVADHDGESIASTILFNDKIFFGGSIFNTSGNVSADSVAAYDPRLNKFERISDPTTVVESLFGEVHAMEEYDGLLYLGGFDMEINNVDAFGIVSWDPETREYSPLGPGPYGFGEQSTRIQALEEVDGKILIGVNGGLYPAGLRVYDPATNTFAAPLGGASTSASVLSIYEVSPTEIYIGGCFDDFGGVATEGLIKYNSVTGVYTQIAVSQGGGVAGCVYSIESIGGDIYFGGNFWETLDSSVSLEYIAKYDPDTDQISALGPGSAGLSDYVNTLATDGTDLFVGGDFLEDNNGNDLNHLTRYDVSDNTFNTMGVLSGSESGVDDQVFTLLYHQGSIYVGGEFIQLGDWTAEYPDREVMNRAARYDVAGNYFQGIGGHHSELNMIRLVADTDDYIYFVNSDDSRNLTFKRQHKVTKEFDFDFYNSPVFSGNTIFDMLSIGDQVYISGSFTTIDGVTVNRIARYDESLDTWSALGVGTVGASSTVSRMKLVGNDLYVIGAFTSAGGVTANDVARYDIVNNTWHDLGTGAGSSTSFSSIETVGNDVYLSCFLACTIDGGSFNFVAKYTKGTDSYSQLYSANNGTSGGIRDMEEIDGQLFIGGVFISAGGETMNRITRYDPVGDTFNEIGTGGNSTVDALAEIDGRLLIDGPTMIDGVDILGTAAYDPDTFAVVNFSEAFPGIKSDLDPLSELEVNLITIAEVDGNYYMAADLRVMRLGIGWWMQNSGDPGPYSGIYSPAIVTDVGDDPEITVSDKTDEHFVIDYWDPGDECIKVISYEFETELFSAASDVVCPGGETTTSWSCDQSELITYYINSNNVYSTEASYPYTSWSTPVLIYGEGINYNISSSVGDDCPIVIWTNGIDPPIVFTGGDVTPPTGGGGSTPPTTTTSGGSTSGSGGTTLPTGLPEAGSSTAGPYLPNWQWGIAVIGREIDERSIRTRQRLI